MSKKSATLKYVLKPGFTHYLREPDEADGLHGDVVKIEAGTVVDLNANQAASFADRFELLTAVKARAEAEVAMAKAATAQAEEQAQVAPAAPADAPPAATEEQVATAATETPESAEADKADAAAQAPAAFELVDVEAHSASDLIAIVGGLETEAQVRQVADDEVSRGARKRSTVLAAADSRLEELGS